jgi:phosphopantothenoylcysteine decarboxylase/phosphopantothenate--cysteine ligase
MLRGTVGDELVGKRIVLGITGSIAAIETVKLARELIRHGADVYPVMSPSAQQIIHPDTIEFATGHKPVLRLTGAVEHVSLCNNADLLLIAPGTANTIAKLAQGIDDTPVTAMGTAAIGAGIPILIVPAMHITMYEQPITQANIEKLKALGIKFIGPHKVEGSAKFVGIDEIVAHVLRNLWKRDLEGQRVLVIAGSTSEPIDAIRRLTNVSTGRTGIELVKSAFDRGADVTLWYGQSPEPYPSYTPIRRFTTVMELKKWVTTRKELNYDIIVVCAAISDYLPEVSREDKIPSELKELSIRLKQAPRILDLIRKTKPRCYLVGFKAEVNVASSKKLIDCAYKRLMKSKLNLIVANDIAKVTREESYIFIIHEDTRVIEVKGGKRHCANKIWDEIVVDLQRDQRRKKR